MNRPTLHTAAVALTLLAATPVLAQDATDADATDDVVAVVEADDDGMDWGWLGLLGLLGLAGLRRPKAVVTTVHATDTVRR